MEYSILVVEDNREISGVVAKYLEREGYGHTIAETGLDALRAFNELEVHLVLLDLMLPDISGFEVLKIIRESSDIPVLIVSAKELEADRLRGFDLGADDYIVKPFSPRELMRRVRAMLKRAYRSERPERIEYDHLVLEHASQTVRLDGAVLELTATEFRILETFMAHRGQLLARDQLIRLSFGTEYEAYDRNVDTYVRKLRSKLGDNPKHPRFIHTKYGAGYCFGESMP